MKDKRARGKEIFCARAFPKRLADVMDGILKRAFGLIERSVRSGSPCVFGVSFNKGSGWPIIVKGYVGPAVLEDFLKMVRDYLDANGVDAEFDFRIDTIQEVPLLNAYEISVTREKRSGTTQADV